MNFRTVCEIMKAYSSKSVSFVITCYIWAVYSERKEVFKKKKRGNICKRARKYR